MKRPERFIHLVESQFTIKSLQTVLTTVKKTDALKAAKHLESKGLKVRVYKTS